jgi:hypothetical protein
MRQLVAIKEANAGVYRYLYIVEPISRTMVASTEPGWKLPPLDHLEILCESAQPVLIEFVYLLGGRDARQVVLTNQVQGVDSDSGHES